MSVALKARATISDHELETFILIREEYQLAKEQMEKLKQHLDDLETQLVAQIQAGSVVSSRFYRVDVREVERRYPAWKEHFIDFAGKDAADRILAETEPKLYRNLSIKPR